MFDRASYTEFLHDAAAQRPAGGIDILHIGSASVKVETHEPAKQPAKRQRKPETEAPADAAPAS
jgi:hypothetical protein